MIVALVLCIAIGGVVMTTVWAFFRLLEFMADPHVTFSGVWRRCKSFLLSHSGKNTRSGR